MLACWLDAHVGMMDDDAVVVMRRVGGWWVVQVDGRVKHHVINPVAKELTGLSTRAAGAELEWLRQDYHHTNSSSGANNKAS